MPNLSKKSKGIILMLLSALFFAMMQTMVKLTGGHIPLFEQIFFRNLISMFIMLFIILKNKKSLFGPAKYQPWLFARSFFGFLGVLCNQPRQSGGCQYAYQNVSFPGNDFCICIPEREDQQNSVSCNVYRADRLCDRCKSDL